MELQPTNSLPPTAGLPVKVTVKNDQDQIIETYVVDFTTHAGRRRIADTAQFAMPRGLTLVTRRLKP